MNLINLIYSFLNTLISNIFFIDENDITEETIFNDDICINFNPDNINCFTSSSVPDYVP